MKLFDKQQLPVDHPLFESGGRGVIALTLLAATTAFFALFFSLLRNFRKFYVPFT